MIYAALIACAAMLTGSTQPAEDWTPLFDGETLGGFVQHGGAASYAAEDGCIVGRTRAGEPNSFLCTDREYGDFVLEFEVLVDRELNSGCQIRSHVRSNTVHGYQVEIEATARAFGGGIYEEGGRGWLAQPTPDQVAHSAFVPGEWNHYRIEAVGARVRTYINGVPIADLLDGRTASGLIGLQVHGVGNRADPLEVRWRGLRIREMGG